MLLDVKTVCILTGSYMVCILQNAALPQRNASFMLCAHLAHEDMRVNMQHLGSCLRLLLDLEVLESDLDTFSQKT